MKIKRVKMISGVQRRIPWREVQVCISDLAFGRLHQKQEERSEAAHSKKDETSRLKVAEEFITCA
jgi:hypothetical protein